MYKILFTIITILVIIFSTCICITKPQMHKSVFVYNSDYKIEPTQEVKVEHQDIPIMEQPAAPQKQQVKFENQDFIETKTIVTSQPKVSVQQQQMKVQTNTVKQATPIKVQNSVVKVQTQNTKPKTTTTKTSTPQIDLQKIVQNNQAIQNTKTVETPKNTVTPAHTAVKTQPVKQVQTTAPAPQKTQTTKINTQTPQPKKVLTLKEEEIAWNIWRSNLNNKIMQDTNLPAVPAGTVFRYKFDVDKYGKITNVQTWSETSKYTPYAIQYMAPVIRNLQGRSILNFPQGTARTNVNAGGAWKISATSRYSTPDDYYDVEKVIK